jgi:dUTP pyrophosphatase
MVAGRRPRDPPNRLTKISSSRVNMAGIFGAIHSPAAACLFSPRRPPSLRPLSPLPSIFPLISRRLHPTSLSTLVMAASNGAAAVDETVAATDSVQEPPQKISKISPLLKVKKLSEKAVLPSRGSALAAGYDLSRYAFSRRTP